MSEELFNILNNAGVTDVESAEKYLSRAISHLQESGNLSLGDDKNLSGLSLELRVQQIFRQLEINIQKGREGMEDFIIINEPSSSYKDNIVIEVKSSKGPNPKLEDLRQLDDWVFDLSGEEEARKHGLGGGIDPVAMITDGLMTSKKTHPTPHKGVFIFNGPVGVPFQERGSSILHPNQLEFVEKRNFCVIGIHDLLSLRQQGPSEVLSVLYSTVGEYKNS